jgi:hypothetical protein
MSKSEGIGGVSSGEREAKGGVAQGLETQIFPLIKIDAEMLSGCF